MRTERLRDKTAGPTRKQDLACFPKPPPGSVKGGSGKQDSEPETGVRRGRKERWRGGAFWEGNAGLARAHKRELIQRVIIVFK